MSWIQVCVVAGVGIWSLILTNSVRRFAAHRKLLDIPNQRSSHSSPTPRGGGLAIVISFSTALVFLGFERTLDPRLVAMLLISGGIVAISGFLDDRYTLPAWTRFLVQACAALVFVAALGSIPRSAFGEFGLYHPAISTLAIVLSLIWSTNLFNFMDGIDGVAGAEAVFYSGVGAWMNMDQGGDFGLTVAMWCLCAASIGFLVWNWAPARIFLGDVGSGFLGIMLPMLGLAASESAPIPMQVWIILGGAFFADATVTLLRRAARGERWSEAHRLHAYQHLARRWRSHARVSVLVTIINVIWLLPWAWYAQKVPKHATASTVAAVLPLFFLALLVGAGKQERVD